MLVEYSKKGATGRAVTDLETRLKPTSVFPDMFMVDGAVLFVPVSDLENPAHRYLGAPADKKEQVLTIYKTVTVTLVLKKQSTMFPKYATAAISHDERDSLVCTLPWNDVRGIVDSMVTIMGQNPMLEPRSVHLAIKANDKGQRHHITDENL